MLSSKVNIFKQYTFIYNCLYVFTDGRVAPAGTIVSVLYDGLYHNEEVYPEPEKFKPERYLNPINKFAFAPFSAGPRSCIGDIFNCFFYLFSLL